MDRSREACEKGAAPRALAAHDTLRLGNPQILCGNGRVAKVAHKEHHEHYEPRIWHIVRDEKPMMVTRHGACEEAIAHAQVHRHGINSIEAADKTQSKKNIVWPGRRLLLGSLSWEPA